MFFLECCCQSAADAMQAAASGASRIELCEDLAHDGVTPSEQTILETLAAVTLPVNILVRCRPGSFVYTAEEVGVMAASIRHCRMLSAIDPEGKEHRVNAVVIGALDEEGKIDTAAVKQLLTAAREGNNPLPVTFHRAFDVCHNPLEAYHQLAALRIERILTSGHAPTALEGADMLRTLVQRSHAAVDAPRILVAGSVRPHNIQALDALVHADEYHSACLEWPKHPE